jgi:hypothetical protein
VKFASLDQFAETYIKPRMESYCSCAKERLGIVIVLKCTSTKIDHVLELSEALKVVEK